MASLLLCTDVLAIRCVEDLVFVGMGPILHVFKHSKLEYKLDCLYPNNIHGIVVGANKKLAVFGAKSICICNIVEEAYGIKIEKQSTDQFNDWIIAIEWILFKERMQLAILFAHNYLFIYDIFHKTSQVISCEKTCILYGGSILETSQENLVIFSGTVFQEILIWEIDTKYYNSNKNMPVLHRLTGHKGVIFSVVCDPCLQFICSTSDDRSVRFWKIKHENSKSNINWKTVKLVPIKTIFVHTARVWKAIIRNDIILTIGEDSLICTWSPSGNVLNKAYYRAPIWSIDMSKDNMIYAGGGDGSVHIQPFGSCKRPETIILPGNTCDFPRYISYLHDGTILVFTELGTLLHYDEEMMYKSTIYLTENRYYIMQVSPNRCFVALASREGYIMICKEYLGTLRQYEKGKIMNSQIFSLQWLSDNQLIACGANGLLKLFFCTENCELQMLAQYILPPSRECWLTAATIYTPMSMLICGDRVGNVHVYKIYYNINKYIDKNLEKPIQTLSKVHGKMGVQSFSVFRENLITSGRDGILRFYQVREETKPLLMLHKKKMPMDWISRILEVKMKKVGEIKEDKNVFIFGFKEVEFIIYNLLNETIVVRIPCGGGHRSWDCIISHTKASFAYLKNKQIHICDLSSSVLFSYPTLQNGFHVKETCCLRYISNFCQKDIFISGGEDCTLRISSFFKNEDNFYTFKNLGIFDGHLSGIKCISVIELHKFTFKYLVFSGGGRAQLKVWGINFGYGQSETKKVQLNIWCSDMNSHMLYDQNQYCKKPWQEGKQSCKVEPETRYMNINTYYSSDQLNYVLVFIGCGDGYLRLFVYDIVTSNIYLKVSTKYVDRCILKMHILSHKCKIIILTMTTDGKLRFFDFTDIISRIYKDANSGNQNIIDFNDVPLAEFSLHQSGINSFDLKHIREDEYLLTTGGDDNLLNIVCFQIYVSENNKLSAKILSKWSTTSAHSTQITGVKFKDEDQICSVGIDQQIIIHRYSCFNGIVHADILTQVFTSVPDVQGMELWHSDRENDTVCIYGRGFEVLSI
ncbi:hypothetical protein P5V15_008815 [Pogonomyrmex californicus]